MSGEPNPDPKNKAASFAVLWLLVGLAPIFILLGTLSHSPASPNFVIGILLVCAICNLLGGIGCLGTIKSTGARVFFGLILGGVFFVLSWGIALFQACSHTNI